MGNSIPESLNWNNTELTKLTDFLAQNNTKAFMVLKDGKIVLEEYWGNNTITNSGSFDENSYWYWASAGKTLTSFLVGIAQEQGSLDIEKKTSDYLGANWTGLSMDKENLIKVRHQLTMTAGLDYEVSNLDCTDAICLQYKADAGNQWYYHNAAYTLLEKIVVNATGADYNQFTDENLEKKIGMSGAWIPNGYNNIYWSTARDAARFGLLILNHGVWENEIIMTDSVYFTAMVSSSQNLNPSYGYLWWLNGKPSIIYPGLPGSFNTSLAPDAPEDLISAMGKNGQFIDVVPGKKIVVIRMGEAPDNSLIPITFHNEMWGKLKALID